MKKNTIGEVIREMESIYQDSNIQPAIGWLIASQFYDEIFEKYGCFPHLFIAGKRESGKTTIGNWLMALVGIDGSGDVFGGTSFSGACRRLNETAPLPYWLDEYKNGGRYHKRWNEFLCGVYTRQTLSDKYPIKTGLMLSGEEVPKSKELLERCVITLLQNAGPSNRVDFQELERLRIAGMGLLTSDLNRKGRKESLLPEILDQIDLEKKELLEQGLTEQGALNLAIPKACKKVYLKKTKPHWQTQLDRAKESLTSNPSFVDIDAPDAEPMDCQISTNLKGWNLEIGMYNSRIGQHWLVVASIDPPDRKFTVEDHQLLGQIAFYLGATKDNLRIMLDPDDRQHQPTMLTWDVSA